MTATLKAIETQYKGYRFRSRLEARWAVLLDELDIAWEYEPEGFELGAGLRYLPDFRLTGRHLWLEVKGGIIDDASRLKAEKLHVASGDAVLIVTSVFRLDLADMNYVLVGGRLAEYQELNSISVGLLLLHRERVWSVRDAINAYHLSLGTDPSVDIQWITDRLLTNADMQLLQCASAAMRGARFEFGENGRLE